MPDFHFECVRTYLTSYNLPASPEFDDGNYWERNPREAPPFALDEDIRREIHEFLEDGIMLPASDKNRTPIKYSKITAEPGAPFQVHFMIWSQQVIHYIDLPDGEDEFLDIRVELNINDQLVDVAYINSKDIKANGIPCGIEFVGERVGDAKEIPMFFTLPSKSPNELKESHINILVSLGRIGEYFYWDKSKVMSKMVRTGPVMGEQYESSSNISEFDGYSWMKKHQHLIRDRAINPKTKAFQWRKSWTMNDLYRLQLLDQAYERCRQKQTDPEAENEDATLNQTPVQAPKSKKAKLSISAIPKSITLTQESEKQSKTPDENSSYSLRRLRSEASGVVGTPSLVAINEVVGKSSSTKRSESKVSSMSIKASNSLTPLQRLSKGASQPLTPASRSKSTTMTLNVQKGDDQRPSEWNVTFGLLPFRTNRQYFRDFIPYQDLCRFQYDIGLGSPSSPPCLK